MSFLPAPLTARSDAPLVRVAGVTRLAAGGTWLVAAVAGGDVRVPAVLCLAALIVLVLWSGLSIRAVAGRFGAVLLAATGLALVAAIASPLNGDAAAPTALAFGPLRVTVPSLVAALALGLRLFAIALTSVLVFGPGDVTALADSLVQQGHLPDRFAYGTVAALGLGPLLAADWTATGTARRLRGREPATLPGRALALGGRLLALLVAAVRRATRMALAMDARGFDSGVLRSRYRLVRLGGLDLLTLVGAVSVAALALASPRL